MRITDFIKQILESDPKQAVFLVKVIVYAYITKESIPAITKLLQHFGILKSAEVCALHEVNNNIEDLRDKITIDSVNLISAVQVVSDRQIAYLTNDQVYIVIRTTFRLLELELVLRIRKAYKDNSALKGLETDLRNILESTLEEFDRYFFQIPNTRGKVLSTEFKVKSFYKKDKEGFSVFDKILLTLKSNRTMDEKESSICLELARLSDFWYLTKRNIV